MTEEEARDIAWELHKWMDKELEKKEEDEFRWVVHEKYFLPANVTTDLQGVWGFINAMARRIKAASDQHHAETT